MLLSGLNPAMSCGPDKCHPRFLKKTAKELSEPICESFNKSLRNGILPKEWKEESVTCIFKKDNRSVPGNYRPVSLNSVLAKLWENVREEIMNHLKQNNLLSDC